MKEEDIKKYLELLKPSNMDKEEALSWIKMMISRRITREEGIPDTWTNLYNSLLITKIRTKKEK